MHTPLISISLIRVVPAAARRRSGPDRNPSSSGSGERGGVQKLPPAPAIVSSSLMAASLSVRSGSAHAFQLLLQLVQERQSVPCAIIFSARLDHPGFFEA